MKWVRVIVADVRDLGAGAFVNLFSAAIQEALKKGTVVPGERFPEVWTASVGEHRRVYFFDPPASEIAREYGVLDGLVAEEIDPPGTHSFKKLNF
ncbi:MAG TPA: hypothetical protein DCX46_05125 [Bacteroidetes bacterium]|nr:hypothetical protein [Bacteroidota bacterium]